MLITVFLAEPCTEFRNFNDLFLRFAEYLLALNRGCGIIKVNDCLPAALQSLIGFFNDMLTGLRQHLNCNVIRNQILFNQRAAEIILRFRCRRKADLDFLEADSHQFPEKLQFFAKAHRGNKCLIAVTQIDAAPGRSTVNICFLRPAHRCFRCGKELSCIFCLRVDHDESSVCEKMLAISLLLCYTIREKYIPIIAQFT